MTNFDGSPRNSGLLSWIVRTAGMGIYGIVVLCVATATTFGPMVLLVLWVSHSPPFSRPAQTSAKSLNFCSTLNAMTTYAGQHSKPTSQQEVEGVFAHVQQVLSAAEPVPSDISGTVSSMIVTSGNLHDLLVTVASNGGRTAAQTQQLANLDSEYTHDGNTLTKWWNSNC